jgi:phage FluMu gp28-like protein
MLKHRGRGYHFSIRTTFCVCPHKANQTFKFKKILVDKTGVGDAIQDEIQQLGIQNTEGLFLTDKWKEEIFTYLRLLMEQKNLSMVPDDKQLITQINEQQYEYLKPKTAQERIHLKYWHPQSHHDDQLHALALTCYTTKEKETEDTLKPAY